MSLRTVLAHLSPLARKMRSSIIPGEGGDPALLFNSIVEAGYLVAAADGTVDSAELSALKGAVRTLTDDEMTAEEVDVLVEDLLDLRKTAGEADRCKTVGRILASHEAGEEGLYLAAAIAYVSGGLDRRELAVLEQIALHARVSSATLAALATSVRDELARRSVVSPPS